MYMVLVDEHEGKGTVGRPRPSWRNISMDLKETEKENEPQSSQNELQTSQK
jgi:hypothetical protein